MDYRTALVNRINDYDSWPGFDRPDFLNELDTIAEKAFAKDTLEGLLASVLIYHQLCEELVRVLIDCSDFLIQLSVYPAAISFKHFKRRMFGQLLNELEAGIDFPERQLFIQHCTEVNAIRIHLVHRLTAATSLPAVRRQSAKIEHLYDTTFRLFAAAYDDYRVAFGDYRKNREWQEEQD